MEIQSCCKFFFSFSIVIGILQEKKNIQKSPLEKRCAAFSILKFIQLLFQYTIQGFFQITLVSSPTKSYRARIWIFLIIWKRDTITIHICLQKLSQWSRKYSGNVKNLHRGILAWTLGIIQYCNNRLDRSVKVLWAKNICIFIKMPTVQKHLFSFG